VSDELTFDLMWMQQLNGATEVMKSNIPASEALDELAAAGRELAMLGNSAGSMVFLRPTGDPLAAVAVELARAREKHAPLHSAHEAYAVILEELDEFKTEVWKKQRERDRTAMRAELIQLAAMAIRAVEDLNL
jgi:hypothetical protein